MRIADVVFYFFMCFGDSLYPLAMVDLFSLPDQNLLSILSGTVYLCDPLQGPVCHGRIGALIFILSYLRARDPERILPYVDRGTFVF